ncbi:MAG: T9SS type A sorting domain-containing protein [Bacteroidales bacterium]|nr:T9SS type A sorting domain-containing protein [Bacteroidales bacterium]MCF8405082.1 T9SS type A sorting domain-containing protein [Bacteroidales bacterium]
MAESEKPEINFIIYPNPISKYLHVKGPVELIDDFRLFDANGKHIMWADKSRLNEMPNLILGIYYLHLLDANGNTLAVEKVLKN